MRKALVAVALIAGGCTSSTNEPVPGPSGQAVRQTKCNGSPDACLRAANKTCKGPYQVVDSSSNSGGLVADILPGPVTWYKMTYQCGPTDGRMPTFPFRGPGYVVPRATTTTCNGFGNTVRCTSY